MEFDRDEAIGAAMNRFWKHGFEAVSASDIADSMAISRSSFYNAFGDRETVFLEALDAYRRITPDAALADIGPHEPVVPAVRRVFREICRVRAADPDARGCLIVNSIGELVGVHPDLGFRIAEAVEAGIATYEHLLSQAADRGEIVRPTDLRATAQAFVAFVSGLNSISKVIRGEADLWRLCESFLASNGFGGA